MKKLYLSLCLSFCTLLVAAPIARAQELPSSGDAVEQTSAEGEEPAGEMTPEQMDNVIGKYRRSSLYTMFIAHPDQKFGTEIQDAFLMMPTPDKFDDHSLDGSFKAITSTVGAKRKNKKSDANFPDIEAHVYGNKIPHQLVAKWFNRNPETGTFDTDLVAQRGNYDATLSDVALADMGARGRAVLADAGEELIGKTFVLINDVTYVDKAEQTKKAGTGLRILGFLGGMFLGSSVSDGMNAIAAVTESFGGFQVNITSYLYRLDWSPEVAATFYQDLWTDRYNYDEGKANGFYDNDLFHLTYIGSHTAKAGNVVVKGFQEETDGALISKVCTRAIDKTIVELQRTYDEFKVNTPILAVEGDDVLVQVGLKEGINERSRFEVLEQIETPEGRTEYRRIAVIAPVKGEIWDNRYMAAEEAAAMEAAGVKNTDTEAVEGNVRLTATRFRKQSGGRLYPGLLVRETTIKAGK